MYITYSTFWDNRVLKSFQLDDWNQSIPGSWKIQHLKFILKLTGFFIYTESVLTHPPVFAHIQTNRNSNKREFLHTLVCLNFQSGKIWLLETFTPSCPEECLQNSVPRARLDLEVHRQPFLLAFGKWNVMALLSVGLAASMGMEHRFPLAALPKE